MDIFNQDDVKKRISEIIVAYTDKLHQILDNYNKSTLKTRENLLVFTENSKQNTLNSMQFCQNKIAEIDNEINELPSHLKEDIAEIQKKHDHKLDENAKIVEKYENDTQDEINKINTEYDILVSMKNDELENLHYLNAKNTKDLNHSLDKEEKKQSKELDTSINDIMTEMDNLKANLEASVEKIKQEFLNTTTLSNQKMRGARNRYIAIERDLRNISLVDIGNYNRQIEENNEKFFVIQRQIINDFKHNLILCSEEYDKLFSEYRSNPLRLLEEQTQNKIKRYSYEIEKNTKIKIEKEKLNTKIQNIKIFKTDYDDSLTFEINRENIKSLMEIAEYERQSALAEAEKNNQIDIDIMECNSSINYEQKALEEKKKELSFFKKRFDIMRKHNNEVADLNSQLYDISITLELDLNQFEREYKINLEKIELNRKKNSIFYLNTVSNLEFEKETIIARLESELSEIDLGIKKIHNSYDHVIFKTRSEYNIEKTRIEHILRFFESKYKKETDTLSNDIDFITNIFSSYRTDLPKLSSFLLSSIKAGKLTILDGVQQFYNTLAKNLETLNLLFREYFGNKALRSTPDIDKMIDDYLEAIQEKRAHLVTECSINEEKIDAIEKEIFSNESDIIYLDSTRKSLLEKGKKDIGRMNDYINKNEYKKMLDEEVSEILEQIEEKNFKIHILKLRLKSQTKDLLSSQNEIARIDEGTKIFMKKESQKLFDLKLDNVYYDNYDVFLQIIYSFIDNMNNTLLLFSNKKKKIGNIYKLSILTISRLNMINDKIKKFSSFVNDSYHEQMKKISRVCSINLLKEKRILERSILSINMEREIAIEEINAHSSIAKKASLESGEKCNNSILALKDNVEASKAKFNLEEIELKRQFTITVGALKENMRKMKAYYSDAQYKLKKSYDAKLASLAKERLVYKNQYEYDLDRLNHEYINEKEKNLDVSKLRLENVHKTSNQKVKDLSNKMKILENLRLRKIKTKTNLIAESNTALYERTKTIENEMQMELANMRRDCYKKLKHEKKKMTISEN